MAVSTGNGVGSVVHKVVDSARNIARLEGELAAYELKRKVAVFGAGAALLAGAAVLALFAVGFGLATVVAAFATFLPTWLSLLIVTGGLLLAAAIAGLAGKSMLRRATPPIPEQAIEEAKKTGEALKGNAHG